MAVKTLYEQDFVAWSTQQAEALRAAARTGSNQLLDWENLAEEIEGLGISQRTALRSQIRRIIRHFVKLQYSPAADPRRGWRESVRDARAEIEDLLTDSPSLRGELHRLVAEENPRGIKDAVADLEDQGETVSLDLVPVRRNSYSTDQILGDWFPEEPRG